MLRHKADSLAADLGVDRQKFLISNKWLRNFCRRHNLANRSVTHRGQQDNRPAAEICTVVKDYLTSARVVTADLSADKIFNMDETPCYFDMCSDQTLHFKGDKNVDGIDTGNRKSRFTTVLAISADGSILRSLIILKGLKNIPKVSCPKNIQLKVTMKGSMNTPIMPEWGKDCFSRRGNYFSRTKSLLIMDSYGSHIKPEIIEYFRKEFNTEILQVPPKTTSFLQPLDVAINGPFKAALRREWEAWFAGGHKEFTPKGYRKRPSYQAIIDMVSNAQYSLRKETVQKSFRCCGISAKGGEVPGEELNTRLKTVLKEDEIGTVELESETDGDSEDDEEIVEAEEGGHVPSGSGLVEDDDWYDDEW